MLFPYLPIRRHGAIRALPIISIRVRGPHSETDLLEVVDSGAEQSVFSIKLIEELDLDVHGATVVEIIGVGSKASRGYLLDVEHQLGRHRWTGPGIFSDAVDSPVILGQAGFFEFFNVTFKRKQLLMDIRVAR